MLAGVSPELGVCIALQQVVLVTICLPPSGFWTPVEENADSNRTFTQYNNEYVVGYIWSPAVLAIPG